MTAEAPKPERTIRLLEYRYFKPERLSLLDNYELFAVEPGAKWSFRHKAHDTKQNQFILEVYRPQKSIKRTAEVNRVSIVFDTPKVMQPITLEEVRFYFVGMIEGEKAVRFIATNNGEFIIRNDGLFSGKGLKIGLDLRG